MPLIVAFITPDQRSCDDVVAVSHKIGPNVDGLSDYSLDGDRWQTIYPKDGIADSRFEQFELVLDGEAGARGLILRAADALNNVASARGEAPEPSGRR